MRKLLPTIFLFVVTLMVLASAALLFVEGSLARLTGWYHFRPGMSLFPEENLNRLSEVSWIRISDLHDVIECERAQDGSWWIISPFRDRMSSQAVQLILNFTANARLVDSLPMNHTTRASIREYGVDTSPHQITLKIQTGKDDMTTLARYTLGSASPWFADAEDGEHLLPTTYLRTDFYGRDKRIHVVSGNILSIFKNGLEGLREPHPVTINVDDLLRLQIKRSADTKTDGKEQIIVLSRDSAQSPWTILSPTLCEANQDAVDELVANLERLKAIRIADAADVKLPERPAVELSFLMQDKTTLRMNIYAPFVSPTDGQLLCYATVSDRSVVFTLAMEPKVQRKGGYANLVNTILSLPILPKDTLVRIRNAMDTVYLADLPMDLDTLRSRHFANLTDKDIDKAVLRSRYAPYPLMLRRIPGDSEGQVDDVWMYATEGQRFREADTKVVEAFLNSLGSVPVDSFLRDFTPLEDTQAEIRKYGLNMPDYLLLVQPRECAARAVLFGVDMPIVRDRAPRTFAIKRYNDGKESYWVGMEQNTLSICRLNPKLTKHFSLSSLNWRKRNLVQFPVSSLRKLTLCYHKAPLELHYDYIGEEWSGTLGGEDVTPRINPHRTNYYVRHLQNIRVKNWISSTDEDAVAALAHPVFTVILELELADYSDVEEIVLDDLRDSTEDLSAPTDEQAVREMLTEKSETDAAFRRIALDEKKTEKRTITIDIAPAKMNSVHPLFYGRLREEGSLFILSFEDAQGLDGQLLDR